MKEKRNKTTKYHKTASVQNYLQIRTNNNNKETQKKNRQKKKIPKIFFFWWLMILVDLFVFFKFMSGIYCTYIIYFLFFWGKNCFFTQRSNSFVILLRKKTCDCVGFDIANESVSMCISCVMCCWAVCGAEYDDAVTWSYMTILTVRRRDL